jgi:hypothetical protein
MANKLPNIVFHPSIIDKASDMALDVLYKAELPIFQRAGKLVIISEIDGGAYDNNHKSTFGVDHAGNAVRFPAVLDLSMYYLRRILLQRIEWLIVSDLLIQSPEVLQCRAVITARGTRLLFKSNWRRR